MVKSTQETSEMFALTSLGVSPSAISSPGSESGQEPSGTPRIDRPASSGPDRALASLSPRQAQAQGLMTSGMYGPLGSTSSTSGAPDIVLGEQVASKDGLAWFDLVAADMESAGYACAPSDTCAAGFGAPHIRSRLYFGAVGQADSAGAGFQVGAGQTGERPGTVQRPERLCDAGGLVNSERTGLEGHGGHVTDGDEPGRDGAQPGRSVAKAACLGRVADTDLDRRPTRGLSVRSGRQNETSSQQSGFGQIGHNSERPGPVNGFWRDADWLGCRDGKWRPIKSGLKPLAHGIAGRVGMLRGYGNALVLPQAQAFIESFTEALDDVRAAA